MRKPWILAAACSTLALAGCASQRAEAVARAQTPPAGVEVTSTRLVAEGSSARLATPAVAAKAPAGKPINATCPVMLGNPVDPKVTAEWKGAIVAFCDANARSTWSADPARYAGNLPRISGLSGSGSDGALAAPVARRRTPSAARVVAAIPKAPPVAAIGSPDGSTAGVPMPVAAPAAFAMGSPDGVALPLAPVAKPVVVAPAPKPVVGKPVAGKQLAPKVTPILPGKTPVTPPAVPVVGDDHGEDCEDCPGGVCRVPGM